MSGKFIKAFNRFSVAILILLLTFNILYIAWEKIDWNKINSGRAESVADLPNPFELRAQGLSQNALLENENNNVSVFENNKHSVVHVTTLEYVRNIFTMDVSEIPKGTGTGIIISDDGLVITNYHVIQNSNKVTVQLFDRTSYEAEVIGYEPSKDIALLRIREAPSNLNPISFGDSDSLRVGYKVLAIGNPFGLDYTLTVGVVSALGREITSPDGVTIRNVIQTDAAINPGNSGGPLLNSSGQLIGINTQIYSLSGSSSGIGFAIPVNKVLKILPSLQKYGKVVRPYLGVYMINDTILRSNNIIGAGIQKVHPSSPAAKAGIEGISISRNGRYVLGDVIVGMNGVKIEEADDLFLELEKYDAGEEVELEIMRNSEVIKLQVKLGELR